MAQLLAVPAFFDAAHVGDFQTLRALSAGNIIDLDVSVIQSPSTAELVDWDRRPAA
jgi:hypothetical protein